MLEFYQATAITDHIGLTDRPNCGEGHGSKVISADVMIGLRKWTRLSMKDAI
jgi:hypothetical protein